MDESSFETDSNIDLNINDGIDLAISMKIKIKLHTMNRNIIKVVKLRLCVHQNYRIHPL